MTTIRPTKEQFNELNGWHVGSGVLMLHSAPNRVETIEVFTSRDGVLRRADNGAPVLPITCYGYTEQFQIERAHGETAVEQLLAEYQQGLVDNPPSLFSPAWSGWVNSVARASMEHRIVVADHQADMVGLVQVDRRPHRHPILLHPAQHLADHPGRGRGPENSPAVGEAGNHARLTPDAALLDDRREPDAAQVNHLPLARCPLSPHQRLLRVAWGIPTMHRPSRPDTPFFVSPHST